MKIYSMAPSGTLREATLKEIVSDIIHEESKDFMAASYKHDISVAFKKLEALKGFDYAVKFLRRELGIPF